MIFPQISASPHFLLFLIYSLRKLAAVVLFSSYKMKSTEISTYYNLYPVFNFWRENTADEATQPWGWELKANAVIAFLYPVFDFFGMRTRQMKRHNLGVGS